jgi:chromosome segregation ATPase
MNEVERRLEILKAEAAIRELAQKMAEAGEYARQADMARNALEAAAKSIEELNFEFRGLMKSHDGALNEESKSMNQAMESLENCTRDLQNAQGRLGKNAEDLEFSLGKKGQEFSENMGKKLDNLSQGFDKVRDQFIARAENLESSVQRQNQEFHELVDAKLSNISQEINNVQEHLSEKADFLEASVAEGNKTHELVDAKLSHLSQEINTISNKFLFVMDQNEASNKKFFALQRTIEELSCRFQGFDNIIDCNSEEIKNLRIHVIESNGTLSSIKNGLEERRSGLVHRLRSAVQWSRFSQVRRSHG